MTSVINIGGERVGVQVFPQTHASGSSAHVGVADRVGRRKVSKDFGGC